MTVLLSMIQKKMEQSIEIRLLWVERHIKTKMTAKLAALRLPMWHIPKATEAMQSM